MKLNSHFNWMSISVCCFLLLGTQRGFADSMDVVQRDYVIARKISKGDMTAVYERLNLTEKQRVQLEENRKRHHAKIKTLTAKIAALQQKLNSELERAQLDRQEIARIKEAIDRSQAELTDLRLKGIMDVREILTPQQYEIFSEIMQ